MGGFSDGEWLDDDALPGELDDGETEVAPAGLPNGGYAVAPERPLPHLGHAITLAHTAFWTREKWLTDRRARRKIGASQVAAVLNMSPYGTALEVWGEARGEIVKEDEKPMARGRALEDLISPHIGLKLGLDEVDLKPFQALPRSPGVYAWKYLMQHPTASCLTTNLDRVLVDQDRNLGVLEIKFHGWRLRDAYSEFEKHGLTAMYQTAINAHYVQIQAQLAVLGPEFTFGVLGACIGEESGLDLAIGLDPDPGDLYVYRFPRDEDMIRTIETQIPAFYRRFVETGRRPPVFNHLDEDFSRRLYGDPRTANKDTRQPPTALPPEAEKMCHDVLVARAAYKGAEREKSRAQGALINVLGDLQTSFAAVGPYTVTFFEDSAGKRTLRVKEDV